MATGNYVKIDHGTLNGHTIKSAYGHNSQILVNQGDHVTQGQVIALAGSTGWSTGPHCHFEIYLDDAVVNPEDFFTADQLDGIMPETGEHIVGTGKYGSATSSTNLNANGTRLFNENQFQGTIKLRRVAPYKDIGKAENVGDGETSSVGGEFVNKSKQLELAKKYIEGWQAGTQLTLSSRASVYDLVNGKLERKKEKQKIRSWIFPNGSTIAYFCKYK